MLDGAVLRIVADPAPDAIDAGEAAWRRIKQADRQRWADWLLVCAALSAGRDAILRAHGLRRPDRWRYRDAWRAWVATHPWVAEMDGSTRAAAVALHNNLPAIERWRAELPQSVRDDLHHPAVVLRRWRRSAHATAEVPRSNAGRRRRDGARAAGGCAGEAVGEGGAHALALAQAIERAEAAEARAHCAEAEVVRLRRLLSRAMIAIRDQRLSLFRADAAMAELHERRSWARPEAPAVRVAM